MDIQISKLVNLMDLVKPAVPKDPALKVLKDICFMGGKAYATDLQTMIVANVPEATDSMCLPYASLVDMVKYIPGSETLHIEMKGEKQALLTWSNGKAVYPAESTVEYPILGSREPTGEGNIDGDILIKALLFMADYTAKEESRPVLQAVALTLGNPIQVAAADGFRIAYQTFGLSFPIETIALIPRESVRVLAHVFNKTPRTPSASADSLIQAITARRYLHLSLFDVNGGKRLKVDFGTSASVIIELVSGTYPHYLDVIPKDEPAVEVQVFSQELEAAVRRVMAAIDGKKGGLIRMEFDNEHIAISAKSDEREISAGISALANKGGAVTVGINSAYLLDYLSGKQGIVTISIINRTSPIGFQYQDAPHVFLMPMFAEADTKKEEKPPEPVTEEPPIDQVTEETQSEVSEEESETETEEADDTQELEANIDEKEEEEGEKETVPPAPPKTKRGRKPAKLA